MMALIYKLYVDEEEKDNRCYIGSTITPIKNRLRQHFHFKNCTSSILINQYGKDKIKYVILEECNKDDRYVREKYWIQNTENIVNKCLPIATHTERLSQYKKYRDSHKDKLKQYMKDYEEKNIEKRNKYKTEYREKNREEFNKKQCKTRKEAKKINCICGSIIKYHGIQEHNKTKKHQAYLNQLNSFIPVCTVEAASATQIHTDNQALSS